MDEAALPLLSGQMDWIVQMLLFGFLALLLFLLSIMAFRRKKYAAGVGFGGVELLSAALSCNAWRWALWTSGKIDWRLLGIRSYPTIALICCAMFLAGGLCTVGNAAAIVKNIKGKG